MALMPALEDASPREGMQDLFKLNKFKFSFMKLFKAKDYCVGVVPTNSDKNIFPLRIREGLIPEDDGDDDEGICLSTSSPCSPTGSCPSAAHREHLL